MAQNDSKKIIRRAVIAMCFFVFICFGYVTAHLVKYQILDHEKYLERAIEQQTMDTTIPAQSGTIYDRNYTPLAVTTTVETVYLSPAEIKEEDRSKICDALSEILGVDRESLYNKSLKKNYYEVVKRKVDRETADKVRAFISEESVKGIHFAEDTKRYYQYGSLGSHIIGFRGNDNQGLQGIELLYDEYLSGTPGKIVTAKNAKGTELPVEYETYVPAKDGQGVVLTMDRIVQQYLESHLETARTENKALNGVAGMIMDVNTGEILAMSTKPDFDLNAPFTITDEQILNDIAQYSEEEQSAKTTEARNKLWRNKLTVDSYEPGSTFKIITASIALEEGIATPTTAGFNCPGYAIVAGRRIGCWKHAGHGAQNLTQGILNSCNPVFMKLGEMIGGKLFMKYVHAFGLTEKTGIDLSGEATGLFHSEKNFNQVQIATTSFGQTFKVTPIQMLTAVSAVANGGKLIEPRVVRQIVEEDEDGNVKVAENISGDVKRQVISKETSEQMCDMLQQAVASGSGRNAYVKGYRVAGKTGTSEKIDEKNEEGVADKRIASFIGFAPADDPQIAILVMIDEPSAGETFGGLIAAPVAGDILADVLPYLGIQPQYTEEELAKMDTSVPKLTGKSSENAIHELKQKDLKYKLVGGEGTIEAQVPSAGEMIPKNGTVVLYTNGKTASKNVTVPNLQMLSIAEARSYLKSAGLNMRIVGNETTMASAKVSSQSPKAGSVVESGSVVTIRFKNYDGVE